jgi:hypothetical protein
LDRFQQVELFEDVVKTIGPIYLLVCNAAINPEIALLQTSDTQKHAQMNSQVRYNYLADERDQLLIPVTDVADFVCRLWAYLPTGCSQVILSHVYQYYLLVCNAAINPEIALLQTSDTQKHAQMNSQVRYNTDVADFVCRLWAYLPTGCSQVILSHVYQYHVCSIGPIYLLVCNAAINPEIALLQTSDTQKHAQMNSQFQSLTSQTLYVDCGPIFPQAVLRSSSRTSTSTT